MREKDFKRQDYLKKFKRENPVSDLFSEKAKKAGNKVVEILKKEDLTYDEAYAILQYAHNELKPKKRNTQEFYQGNRKIGEHETDLF